MLVSQKLRLKYQALNRVIKIIRINLVVSAVLAFMISVIAGYVGTIDGGSYSFNIDVFVSALIIFFFVGFLLTYIGVFIKDLLFKD